MLDVDYDAPDGTQRSSRAVPVENRKDGYHWNDTPRIPRPMQATEIAEDVGHEAEERPGERPGPGTCRSRALSTAARVQKPESAKVPARHVRRDILTQTWWYRMELIANSRGEWEDADTESAATV